MPELKAVLARLIHLLPRLAPFVDETAAVAAARYSYRRERSRARAGDILATDVEAFVWAAVDWVLVNRDPMYHRLRKMRGSPNVPPSDAAALELICSAGSWDDFHSNPFAVLAHQDRTAEHIARRRFAQLAKDLGLPVSKSVLALFLSPMRERLVEHVMRPLENDLSTAAHQETRLSIVVDGNVDASTFAEFLFELACLYGELSGGDELVIADIRTPSVSMEFV